MRYVNTESGSTRTDSLKSVGIIGCSARHRCRPNSRVSPMPVQILRFTYSPIEVMQNRSVSQNSANRCAIQPVDLFGERFSPIQHLYWPILRSRRKSAIARDFTAMATSRKSRRLLAALLQSPTRLLGFRRGTSSPLTAEKICNRRCCISLCTRPKNALGPTRSMVVPRRLRRNAAIFHRHLEYRAILELSGLLAV